MNIEIVSIRHFRGDHGKYSYRKLALADVVISDLTLAIRGVMLTFSDREGFIAMAPHAAAETDRVVRWHYQSDFGRELAEALARAWRGIGGKLERAELVPAGNAALNKPQPIERRVVPATFAVHEDADDNEAVEGLHRTLGIEHEEAHRACG
ncbi:hypothetical protein LJR251_001637 [Rhizobium rhizogenes]|uniref:hypothetical protein n=1 Tax=Rhizobium rhizogenes TaxID=359 RepID=UPI003ED0039B